MNDQFLNSLELLTPEGKYNYVAYLLADENGVSIKVAKYAGKDKVDLIENEEYGYCSLIKATYHVLEKLKIENSTKAKVTSSKRIEKNLVELIPMREAIINTIVHSDFTREIPPVFEIFSDRMVFTSYGGLIPGQSESDFFSCSSMPRNRELMRVFKDLGLVEQLGSGMSRILKSYDKSIFKIFDHFIKVEFPFSCYCIEKNKNGLDNGTYVLDNVLENDVNVLDNIILNNYNNEFGNDNGIENGNENESGNDNGIENGNENEFGNDNGIENGNENESGNDNGIENGDDNEVGNDIGIDKLEITYDAQVLFLLEKQPDITIRNLSIQLHISQRKVSRILKILRDDGIIVRIGSDRKGYWKIKKH